MQTADFNEFKTLMGQLCEVYDRKRTQEVEDAYWTALDHMSLRDFKLAQKLAVQRAGNDGYERMPKPGKFWQYRDEAKPRVHAQRRESQRTVVKTEEMCKANMALLGFLMRHPKPIHSTTLDRLVAEKNRVGRAMEIVATEEQVTLDDVKRVLTPCLQKIVSEPQPHQEQAA